MGILRPGLGKKAQTWVDASIRATDSQLSTRATDFRKAAITWIGHNSATTEAQKARKTWNKLSVEWKNCG